MDTLCEAVKTVRRDQPRHQTLSRTRSSRISRSVQSDAPELADWVQDEAWGHHACGTCRMGFDKWREDAAKISGTKTPCSTASSACHGVCGLRVVDASVFRDIPGYFIVTPVFMIAEKAADTLLADSDEYPGELEGREASSYGGGALAANSIRHP